MTFIPVLKRGDVGTFNVCDFRSADEFIMAMLQLGTPLELSLVGAFDRRGQGRASRQDVDLPLHRDGVYSPALADVQQGHYVESAVPITFVGLYCFRAGVEPCYTTILQYGDDLQKINLKVGQALIFDNRKVEHGRTGPVGDRLLIRMWIGEKETVE